MTVPDFQTVMLPILRLLSDGRTPRIVPDLVDPLADFFHLSPEERQQMLPSGLQGTLANRTQWAVTYMAKAGLIARPSRGRVAITGEGRKALASNPSRIDIAFLHHYPSFVAFRTRAKPPSTAGAEPQPPSVLTDEQNPEELLYRTYDALRSAIEAELLERLQAPEYPWEAFERLVVELLGAMDYGSSTDATSLHVTQGL